MRRSVGIFKRCGCKDITTGRRLEKTCPRLAERGHRTWYFHCSATNLLGRSEWARRGGNLWQAAVRRARDEWLARTGEERTAKSWTVERWLRYWLSTPTSIRATTKLHYTRDVEHFLIPYLGRLCLADRDTRRLRAVFAQIAKTSNHRGQPQSPSCLQHLRTTLRAALNLAVRGRGHRRQPSQRADSHRRSEVRRARLRALVSRGRVVPRSPTLRRAGAASQPVRWPRFGPRRPVG